MKNTFTIVSLLFLLNSFGQNLNFEILFGNYANDHFEKKFHVQERKWVLDNDQLSYSIDEHDTRYADTLTLTKEEQKRISDYVLKEGLNQNIEEEIEKDSEEYDDLYNKWYDDNIDNFYYDFTFIKLPILS